MDDGHGAVLGRSICAAHRVRLGMNLGCWIPASCRPLVGGIAEAQFMQSLSICGAR